MQKLLSAPVVAPFFFIFGIVLAPAGYHTLKRGSIEYIPQQGPHQIFSPTSQPPAYWALSAGVLAVGVICLALSAYAALCQFRAARAPIGPTQQPSRRRMFMFAFAMFIILFALVTTMCSHH